MSTISAIVLCNDPIAIPALRSLAFYGQLAGVGIPEDNKDTILEIQEALSDSRVFVTELKNAERTTQLIDLFSSASASVGLMMTFPWKLGKTIIDLPSRGFFNFHYGILPQYRGADPVFAQLKQKEPFPGLTVHLVGEEMDKGDILMQEKLQWQVTMTYGWLKNKLGVLGAAMSVRLMEILSYSDHLIVRPQDESKAHWYKRPGANEVMIDWKLMDAQSILALINACNPWNKGAGTLINGIGIRILEAEIIHDHLTENFVPGRINFLNSGSVEVCTCDSKSIRLNIIYTPEGFMNAGRLAEFGINKGDSFE